MNSTKLIRDQIGGRWAISLKVCLWLLPVTVIFAPLAEASISESDNLINYIYAASISAIPPAIIVYIAHLTLFKNRAVHPLPSYAVVLLGLVAGAIKGATLGLAMSWLDLHSTINISTPFRALNSALLGAIALPVTSIFMTTWEYAHRRQPELIQEAIRIQAARRQSQGVRDEMGLLDSGRIQSQITEIFQKCKSEVESLVSVDLGSSWNEISNLLRETAEKSIRPMSHNLYKSERGISRTTQLDRRLIISSVNFEIFWIAFLFLATNFGNMTHLYSLEVSIIVSLVKFSLIVLIFYLMRSIYSNIKIYRIPGFIVFGGLGIFLYSTAKELLPKNLSLTYSYIDIVLEGFWLAFLIFVTGLFGSYINAQEYELRMLQSMVNSEKIELLTTEKETNSYSRKMAKHLHGAIQSRLMASALAVEIAGRDGDLITLSSEIARAVKTLEFQDFNIDIPQALSLEQVFSQIDSLWGDLLEIEFTTSGTFRPQNLTTLSILAELLGEATSNAYRHGRATWLKIEIQGGAPNLLSVSITDNGVGVKEVAAGLGSDLLTVACGGNWKLSNRENETGAVLNFILEERIDG